MGMSSVSGPLVVFGQNPASSGYTPDNNADNAPSAFALGTMLIDPRVGYRSGLQAGRIATLGWMSSAPIMAIDQVPSTAAVANIAAAANVTSGTAMTLVSSSGSGITISTAATTFLQTGRTLASGSLFIDLVPANISFGETGVIAVVDPRRSIGRAVSVTGSALATGGNIIVRGYDIYGAAMAETIAAPASATTVNGKKAFKAIASVTPQFTDAHNYSIGTADIFGFPLAVYNFGNVDIVWNNARITASTGWLTADVNTATATTGDVRGTYAVQSASDNSKRLQVLLTVSPWNAEAATGATSLFGMAQYTV